MTRTEAESFTIEAAIEAGFTFDGNMVRYFANEKAILAFSRMCERKGRFTLDFDAMAPEQEKLAIQFCEEIAGRKGEKGSLPDPVRLLEMAAALAKAEAVAR